MIRVPRVVIAVAVLTCLFEPSNAVSECIPNPSGLISLWSGDRDARDVLGGNDGILVNGAEAGVPGQVGGAFSLDGVDDSVEIANNPVFDVTNALTLEAWIKLTTLKVDQKIFSHITSYEMGIYNEKLELIPNESVVHRQVPGGTVLQTDTWYHVVTTWDGVRITSYVNGELDRSVAFNDPLDAGISSFNIGSESGGVINFAGHIDEAAFYIRALTAEEVQEHYQLGLLHQEFCIFSDGFENAPTAFCGSCVNENKCLGPTDQCLELDAGFYCS